MARSDNSFKPVNSGKKPAKAKAATESEDGTRRCGSCRVHRPLVQFVRSSRAFGEIKTDWGSCNYCKRRSKGNAMGLTDEEFAHRYTGGPKPTADEEKEEEEEQDDEEEKFVN